MTPEQAEIAERTALILDQLTAAGGLAKTLTTVLIEHKRAFDAMRAPVANAADAARIETLQRELAEAREARDKAEAIVVSLRQRIIVLDAKIAGRDKDIRTLNKLSRECKGFAPKQKGKRRAR